MPALGHDLGDPSDRRPAGPETVADWVSVILDEHANPGDLHHCVNRLADHFFELTGVRTGELGETPDTQQTALDCGRAISPADAASCLRDVARTTAFLRGTAKALEQLRGERDARPVEVLYAGCGPFAALVSPLLHRFRPGDLRVHLLDVHPRSLTACRELIEALGAGGHVAAYHLEDAAHYLHQGPPPRLVITETMQAALENEGQVAITAKLAGQMDPAGILIPERIRLVAAMIDPGREFSADPVRCESRETSRIRIGPALVLERASAARFTRDAGTPAAEVPAAELTVPDDLPPDRELWILTEIEVFDGIQVLPHQSGLTLPRPAHVDRTPRAGDSLSFSYRLGPAPQLRCRVASRPAGPASEAPAISPSP